MTRKNSHRRRMHKFRIQSFMEFEHVFCAYCTKELIPPGGSIDHIVPRSKGGTDRKENLLMCCQPCNVRKGDMPYMSFVKEIDRDLRGTEAEG